ncbi:hypothetical protein PO124_31235 [Bacillus licheniformis]|nr:hypothetical protein [Bacillus licheniformis]
MDGQRAENGKPPQSWKSMGSLPTTRIILRKKEEYEIICCRFIGEPSDRCCATQSICSAAPPFSLADFIETRPEAFCSAFDRLFAARAKSRSSNYA